MKDVVPDSVLAAKRREYRNERNRHLDRAIEALHAAEKSEREMLEYSYQQDIAFGQGYSQGVHEMCVGVVRWWKGTQ